MKTKKVNRYYCDFCKKAGCNAYWIRRHEERCTMNPNRFCGFCKMLDNEQLPMASLIELLPNPGKFTKVDEFGDKYITGFDEAMKKALDKLRDTTGNCPACILAAIRQSGIPVYATKFDFKRECQNVWDAINAENLSNSCYG